MADSNLITRERLANYHDELMKDVVNPLNEKKANIDGFYEGMGVGVAKRLEGNTDVAGSFLERTTGGDVELANGLAQLNEVQGGSVKFNQKCNITEAVSLQRETNRTITNYFARTDNAGKVYVTFRLSNVEQSTTSTNRVGTYLRKGNASSGSVTEVKYYPIENGRCSYIYDTTDYADRIYTFIDNNCSDNTACTLSNIQVIDLTAIFGTGNEPESVEAFEAWLAENVGVKDYYEYTENVVVNNNMTGIESNGFNLFNPTTGKARIIGAYSEVYGNYYGIVGTYGTLTFEDDLGNVSTVTPDADGKFELDVSGYLSVANAGNDVAVFLWWDGKKTEYEDYDVDIAHLDVRHIYGKKNGVGELVQVWPTGMPRINDVVDKLCIENGAVVAKRPIQEVDMGTLTWKSSSAGGDNCFTASVEGRAYANSNYISSKYKDVGVKTGWNLIGDKELASTSSSSTSILLRDTSYTDKDVLKASLSGIPLYYELATPETYTDLVYMGSEYFADGTPVALPVNYKVDNWGVETILPKNTSTILTARPTIKVRYAIDAVEQLNTHSDEIDNLYEGLDELDEAKANTAGVYDNMVAGAAKAIAGNQRLDKVFTSMVVEGADGVAKINEVRGKSLVWNQIIQNGSNFTDTTNWQKPSKSTLSVSDGCLVYEHGGANPKYFTQNCPTQDNHKYYFSVIAKHNLDASGKNTIGFTNMETNSVASEISLTTSFQHFRAILDSGENKGLSRILFKTTVTAEGYLVTFKSYNVIDLTSMFGAGNEPATVEEFEALFLDAYYEYNAGEIINNATEELDVYDSEETLKSTLPLNLTTITGKQVGVEDAESVVIFPYGMRQAGSVADTLLVDDDGYARRALVKIGSRAYQSGDESDSTVVTDLTNTLYALATVSEYTLDEPILMTFKAYHGGTIVQSPQAPDSAPMSMNVTFALDAVGTLNNLPKNYISADSMDAFLAQLGTAMNGTWTKSWDAANNRYGFTFTPNTEGE